MNTEKKPETAEKKEDGGVGKKILKTVVWVLIIWLILLVILQIALSPAVLTGMVEKYAGNYVDADLSFKKIGVSMFRAFPNVSLRMEDCAVTYSHEKFDSLIGRDMPVQFLGRGRIVAGGDEGEDIQEKKYPNDTLAVFDRFDLKINPFGLLFWKLDIPEISVSKPRVFAHTYRDGSSNWDIMADDGTEMASVNDSTNISEGDSKLPRIAFGKIRLGEKPTIVYSNARDTMSAFISMKEMAFAGRLSSSFSNSKKIELEVDSLFAAGRMAGDTLLAGIDRLHIDGRNGKNIHLDIESKAHIGTKEWGRLEVPVSLRGDADIAEDSVPAFDFKEINGNVAFIPFVLSGKMRILPDSLYVNATMSTMELDIAKILEQYGKLVSQDASVVKTDAKFSAMLVADWNYVWSGGSLPRLSGLFSMPKSHVSIAGTGFSGEVELEGEISTDDKGRYDLNLSDICLYLLGTTHLDGSLGLLDILGNDITLKPDIVFSSKLDDISAMLPDSLGLNASGMLGGKAKGSVRMSQLDLYRLPEANLDIDLNADRLHLADAKDSIEVYVDSLDFCLVTKRGKIDEEQKRESRMMELNASVDTIRAVYGKEIDFKGRNIKLSMKNDAGVLSRKDTTIFYPMIGHLTGYLLSLKDGDDTSFDLKETDNTFRITHINEDSKIPLLSFSSTNKVIRAKSTEGRVLATGVSISARARKNDATDRKARRERRLDSLARIWPGVPRDSLFSVAYRSRLGSKNVPEWLKEQDWRRQDFSFSLDETMKKYFREWGINGGLSLNKARIVTTLLPLRNTVSDVQLSFTNNDISLKNICLASGESDLDISGSLTGLRRAVLGRGPVKADIKLVANKLDCNELLAAYAAGQKVSGTTDGTLEESDSEYLDAAVTEMSKEKTDSTAGGLFIVPANIIANVTVEGYDISYSNMVIDWLNCNVMMKERCIQIYNTVAAANMGNLFFEGFYATRSKTNIKTGFNLSLVDLTAGEVFNMMPQVKEIVPMLSSFDGLLNCEIAGTAALDTNMNFIMPTMRGIMRIGGKDLTLAQDESLRKITKLLKFKNKGDLKINSMSVEGQISDSRLEVFPFIVDVDRYELAMSGIQNLDMSFRYHVSVIKSPLVFRFGVDLFGNDFDHLKFRIGKAKYRNAQSIPVFTKTIDESKLNLSNTIRNVFETGVEQAIAITERQDAIRRQKEETGYVAAVDEDVVPLSEEEKKELEEQEVNQQIE